MQCTEQTTDRIFDIEQILAIWNSVTKEYFAAHLFQLIPETWTCFRQLKYIIYNFKLFPTEFRPPVCVRSAAGPGARGHQLQETVLLGWRRTTLVHISSHIPLLIICNLFFIFIRSLSCDDKN